MTAFNLPPGTLPIREVVEFEVWPENEAPLAVLIAMRGQRRYAGMDGRVIGLEYSALPWVMQQVGIAEADTADVFTRLQQAEDAMVEYLNQ